MFGKLVSAVAAFGLVLGVSFTAEAKKPKSECVEPKTGKFLITPEHELKMVTLAPQGSEWSKQFTKWSDEVLEESDCKVYLKWYFNSSNEQSILDELKNGVKHGAAMTATGLSAIDVNFLLFQMPGAYANWPELDKYREAGKADIEKRFNDKGFVILGAGDIGAAKIMTVSGPARTPKDFAGKGVFHLPGDVIAPKLLAQIPGAIGKPMVLTEVSTHLGKDIEVLTTAPFVAEQLQWASKVNHVTLITPAFAAGALVIKKEKLEALGEANRELLFKTGKHYGNELTKNIRQFDAAALANMKKSKNVVELTPAEAAEWDEVFKKTRAAVKGLFDPGLWNKLLPENKR
ncbi:MAG: TRAP transporter substrate-binding protein DctP [Myxococcales bacterium]|nr:TRAP transporter substrate-binding protein DctP [Myxococcales bacterium]